MDISEVSAEAGTRSWHGLCNDAGCRVRKYGFEAEDYSDKAAASRFECLCTT